MDNQTQQPQVPRGAEKFDPAFRQIPGFAEALERVKRLQAVFDQFESPLKPVDASTGGKWKSSRLDLHCLTPD